MPRQRDARGRRFPLAERVADLLPHRLCEYLYFLAGKFTDFHRDCNVLGADTAARALDCGRDVVDALLALVASPVRQVSDAPQPQMGGF